MKKNIYINGIGNISPQDSFDQAMGNEIVSAEGAFFACQEPPYKQFIQKKLLRRMSRIVRMGLASSYKALEEAKNPVIDAIITGTAWGCVKETEKFLGTIIENNEEYLTPTAFVQSTHNTVAGQIALMHHNNCYNMTYVQGNVSFESALIDALLLFLDGKAQNILVAGVDEQTDQLKILMKRLSCARESQPMGEGAACFVLSNSKEENSYAKIAGVNMLYRPKESAAVKNNIIRILKENNMDFTDIDLVLTGNKHPTLEQELFPDTSIFNYKKLCGEYPTSTAFAMALGANLIKGNYNSKKALGLNKDNINNLLIYNQADNINHSVIVLSKV